jgi:hypothetical protein
MLSNYSEIDSHVETSEEIKELTNQEVLVVMAIILFWVNNIIGCLLILTVLFNR